MEPATALVCERLERMLRQRLRRAQASLLEAVLSDECFEAVAPELKALHGEIHTILTDLAKLEVHRMGDVFDEPPRTPPTVQQKPRARRALAPADGSPQRALEPAPRRRRALAPAGASPNAAADDALLAAFVAGRSDRPSPPTMGREAREPASPAAASEARPADKGTQSLDGLTRLLAKIEKGKTPQAVSPSTTPPHAAVSPSSTPSGRNRPCVATCATYSPPPTKRLVPPQRPRLQNHQDLARSLELALAREKGART
jgi:hypothetical protein